MLITRLAEAAVRLRFPPLKSGRKAAVAAADIQRPVVPEVVVVAAALTADRVVCLKSPVALAYPGRGTLVELAVRHGIIKPVALVVAEPRRLAKEPVPREFRVRAAMVASATSWVMTRCLPVAVAAATGLRPSRHLAEAAVAETAVIIHLQSSLLREKTDKAAAVAADPGLAIVARMLPVKAAAVS